MRKTVLINGIAATLALTLIACGGGSSPAAPESSASDTASATATETEPTTETTDVAESNSASDDESAETGNIDPVSARSEELFEARLAVQETMKAVMTDWDAYSAQAAIDGGQAGLDAAYEEALAQIEARRDEGLAAIDATSDPDSVKQYWKDEVEVEYQQYCKNMQDIYDLAASSWL